MTVPTDAVWSVDAKVAAHTAVLALLDSGLLRVRSSADALLAQISLDSPAGTLNGTTGVLTINGAPGTILANGTAAYAELCEADGTVVVAMPVVAGVTTTSNRIAINSLTLLNGAALTLLTSTIG